MFNRSGELYFDLVLFTARRISVGDVLLGLDPYEWPADK